MSSGHCPKKSFTTNIISTSFTTPSSSARFVGLGDALYSFGEFAVDGLVSGTVALVGASANQFRKLQNGSIGFYVFAMVLSLAVIIAVRMFNWQNLFSF